jgi:crossover junction endodeoxyribonuclease RuvC
MVKILGIDPGSLKAGYAAVVLENNCTRIETFGVLRFNPKISFIDRVGLIFKAFENLNRSFSPDEIALEALIHVKNISSMVKLAQARGATMAAFSQGKLFEYGPTMVKSTLTGNGQTPKKGIQKSLSMMFGPLKFESDDASDALAIAVCHVLNRNYDRTIKR